MAFPVADGASHASPEHLARRLGDHNLSCAWTVGLGGARPDSAGACAIHAASGIHHSCQVHGVAPFRLLCKHVMPNLRPVLLAQFWISVPVFILYEANISILGLGVAEPLPSLGVLLRELETVLSLRADIWRFAPLLMLVLMVSSLQIAVSEQEVSS